MPLSVIESVMYRGLQARDYLVVPRLTWNFVFSQQFINLPLLRNSDSINYEVSRDYQQLLERQVREHIEAPTTRLALPTPPVYARYARWNCAFVVSNLQYFWFFSGNYNPDTKESVTYEKRQMLKLGAELTAEIEGKSIDDIWMKRLLLRSMSYDKPFTEQLGIYVVNPPKLP